MKMKNPQKKKETTMVTNHDDQKRYKPEPRLPEKVKAVQSRINRVVGQLNGVKRMLDENRACEDILIQLSACEKAVRSIAIVLLEDHMGSCISQRIREHDENVVKEFIDIIKKMD